MRRILTIAMVAVAASLIGASAAIALVLDEKTDAQKWRKDYQKQRGD